MAYPLVVGRINCLARLLLLFLCVFLWEVPRLFFSNKSDGEYQVGAQKDDKIIIFQCVGLNEAYRCEYLVPSWENPLRIQRCVLGGGVSLGGVL